MNELNQEILIEMIKRQIDNMCGANPRRHIQEVEIGGLAAGTVEIEVDTRALAEKIRNILPTEVQKDKETMEKLFADLRSMIDEPATGIPADEREEEESGPGPLPSIAQPAK